jgi:hypothetical protein
MGRAAGCPARFGRGCGRKGVPGVGLASGAEASLGGAGACGMLRATGWAGCATAAGGGIGAAGVGDGRGCRGPDNICPGRGVGTGRAGTGPVRIGGCSGAVPPGNNGGLKGAGLLRGGSSIGLLAELPGVLTGVVTGASWAGVAVGDSTSGRAILAAGAGCSGAALGTCCGVKCSCRADGSCRAASSTGSRSATATEASASRRIAAPAPPCTLWRIISATGSSTELEWVFFSVTPSSGNMSMMACEGTSSCLASSLIRILLINNGNTGLRCA